jgi:amino acid adenylation domain-containing protein
VAPSTVLLLAFQHVLARFSEERSPVVWVRTTPERWTVVRTAQAPTFRGALKPLDAQVSAGVAPAIRPEGLPSVGFEPSGSTQATEEASPVSHELSLGVDSEVSQLTLRYDAELFEATTPERLLETLELALDRLVRGPDASPSALNVLPPAQERLLFGDWLGRQVVSPKFSLPELLAQRWASFSQRTAVVTESGSFTYGELERRSHALARLLGTVGVKRETRVALVMERGAEVPIALVGILRAGGAFVNIDATYPADRIRFMLSDSGASVVLIQERLRARLPPTNATVLAVDTLALEEAPPGGDLSVSSDNLAYLVYTSGTTGEPKAVSVTHAGFVNMVVHRAPLLGPTTDERVLQLCPLGFDAGISDVFTALYNGAELHLVSEEKLHAGTALQETLAQRRITFLSAPPSLLTATPSEGLPELRVVDTGAEVCPTATLERWGKNRRLVIGYGPAEATVQVSAATSEAGPVKTGTLGSAMPNRRLYVLDAGMLPVPPGAPGELFIGGEGLARGYLGHSALTAERFMPDPFATQPGQRMYRTGDKVRFSGHGELHFLGRADFQVKIRGFRIELGELESRISLLPGVGQVAVTAREDVPGQRRLVAYVVGDATLELGALKTALAEQVPDYMVPAVFLRLEALPTTPNGKLDRAALPAPPAGDSEDRPFVAPRNPVEEKLAAVWRKVLNLERVSVEDDFFEVGGDSITSMHIVSRSRRVGLNFTIQQFKQNMTIAKLAALFPGGAAANVATKSVASAEPVPALPKRHPLSSWQQSHWFQANLSPGNEVRGIFVFRFSTLVDVPRLRRALEALMQRHPVLRSTFGTDKGVPYQEIHDSLPLDFQEIDGTEWSNEELQEEIRAQHETSFDLTRPPLLRFRLIKLADGRQCLVKSTPHILMEAWSLRLLLFDLAQLYETDGAKPLPPIERSFHEFVAWEQKLLEGPDGARQLAFWTDALAGVPHALDLKADHARPPVVQRRSGDHAFALLPGQRDRLDALARAEHVTAFSILLAAFNLMLHKRSGQNDLVIGVTVTVRPAGFEDVVGYCLNHVPIRSRLESTATFRELLARTHQAQQNAISNGDYPLPTLLERLRIPRDPSRGRLIQVSMNYNNNYARLSSTETGSRFKESPGESGGLHLELGTLQGELLPLEERESPFDLEWMVIEGGGQLLGHLLYAQALFEPSTVQSMADDLIRILERALEDPSLPVSSLL